MKKLLLVILISPLLFASCTGSFNSENANSGEVNGSTLIDPAPLEEKAQLMKEAFANKSVDDMLALFVEDMQWMLPNSQMIKGKEQARAVFTNVFSQWEEMRMDAGDDENPPIILATSSKNNGRWLLRWSPYYYKALNGKEITLSFHTVMWFNDNDKIKGMYTYYDRSGLTKMYDEGDPLEAIDN